MANPVKKLRNLIGDIMGAMIECSREGVKGEAYLEFTGVVEYDLEDAMGVDLPVLTGVIPRYKVERDKDQGSNFRAVIKITV